MIRKLIDRSLSIGQNSQAMLLKSRLALAEGDSRQAVQMALKAVKMDGEVEPITGGGDAGQRAVFGEWLKVETERDTVGAEWKENDTVDR